MLPTPTACVRPSKRRRATSGRRFRPESALSANERETINVGLIDLLHDHGDRPFMPRKPVFGKGQQVAPRAIVRRGRDWAPSFLCRLRRLGNIEETAIRGGVTVEMVVQRQADEPEFKAACEQMLAQYAERQERRTLSPKPGSSGFGLVVTVATRVRIQFRIF